MALGFGIVGQAVFLDAAPGAENDAASGAPALEEIVVTATRRAERLQDIPVSATAFTQEKLDVQGLRSIDDLTRLTPGVTFQRDAATSAGNFNDEDSDINIRGIDSTAGTSTVGIYIDDMLRELLNRLEDSIQEIAPRCRTQSVAHDTVAEV